MTKSHRYRAHLIWTGAEQGPTKEYASYSRDYQVRIEGKAALKSSADPSFKGNASLWNPEELLLAALAGCHMLSYLALCTKHGIEVTAYEGAAEGTMEIERGSGRFTSVTLRPRVTIGAGDANKARALHDDAHRLCFIANSVNFPVTIEPEIVAA